MRDEDRWGEHAAGGPPRIVIDPETGRRWRVWVVDTSRTPGAPAPECLIFDSSDVTRRAWVVPADWRALPPAELLELPWRRAT